MTLLFFLLFFLGNGVWLEGPSETVQESEKGPPPYLAPPTYYNTAAFAQNTVVTDPFDTSNIFLNPMTQPHTTQEISPTTSIVTGTESSSSSLLSSNLVSEFSQKINNTATSNLNRNLGFKTSYVQSDITNRSINYTKPIGSERDSIVAVSKSISAVKKDVAVPLATKSNKENEELAASMSSVKLNDSPKKAFDGKFLIDLEKYLMGKEKSSDIPVLDPPPQSKSMKKSEVAVTSLKTDNSE